MIFLIVNNYTVFYAIKVVLELILLLLHQVFLYNQPRNVELLTVSGEYQHEVDRD